jgi:hypothetical protein
MRAESVIKLDQLDGGGDEDDDCDAYIQERVTLLFTDYVFCDGENA